MTQHSKDTVVKIAATNLAAYLTSTTFNRSADSHENTTYGLDAKTYAGGLKDGTITFEGFYDTTAVSGLDTVVEPLLSTTAAIVVQFKGTGTGKPQLSCNGVITSYNISSPVADLVTCTIEVQISGAVSTTPQA